MNLRVKTAAAALVLLLGAIAAQDAPSAEKLDIVRLKNGHEFIGRVVRETEDMVAIVFRGGEIELPMRRVQEIIRAERKEVEAKATQDLVVLGRYDERKEQFYVYYRGKRVGWRETSLVRQSRDGVLGYLFTDRTVYLRDGAELDIDVRIDEFCGPELEPIAVTVSEMSSDFTSLVKGAVAKGHMSLRTVGTQQAEASEIVFADETEFQLPLLRRLADRTHFPERGEWVKVYDPLRRRFLRVHATRSLRKELVQGRHQFVTVWRLDDGDRVREVWVDGYGGVVREELGSPNMVALRADPDAVQAYARGEAVDEDGIDLELAYENVVQKFKLARPNLSWSMELPDEEGAHALTLLNPTLQASVDVLVLERVGEHTEPETMALDLLDRMRRKSERMEILFQRTETVAGTSGLRFEAKSDRKGTDLRTMGQIAVAGDRAYLLLAAAPTFRFDEAREQMERILQSFETTAVIPAGRE